MEVTVRTPGEPRFLADEMLARLARWLRVLGFDTRFEPAAEDAYLVALAATEDRVLLTRDRHLVTHLRPERALLITSDAPLAQLREVVAACDLVLDGELFRRCLVCNAELRPATESEITTLLPERARATDGPVWRCPECARLYWPGSHTRRMRAALARTLPGQFR